MKPVIRNETVLRIQKIVNEPISRGMDLAINKCLDKLDEFETKENSESFDDE